MNNSLDKELNFARAPITLSITNTTANKSTSQTSTVTIYDKEQNVQVQYKYKKDTGTLDFMMKSDDVIKIKKGQSLVLTVKVNGPKREVPFTSNISGNFTTLSVVQEEEHKDDDDRKQQTFTLFYPTNLTTDTNYTLALFMEECESIRAMIALFLLVIV